MKQIPRSPTNTLSYLIDKWGKLRLNSDEIANELGYANAKVVLNLISLQRFPIHTYKQGGTRFADLRDIANYYDSNCAAITSKDK